MEGGGFVMPEVYPKGMNPRLRCQVRPLHSCKSYRFVVVCSRLDGKWLLSRHRDRETWETQGGHVEAGETPLEAARRELYEESGAVEAKLYPVCDYRGYDGDSFADGMVFYAEIRRLGALPNLEMRETGLFETLPDRLTYPNVTPILMDMALEFIKNRKI